LLYFLRINLEKESANDGTDENSDGESSASLKREAFTVLRSDTCVGASSAGSRVSAGSATSRASIASSSSITTSTVEVVASSVAGLAFALVIRAVNATSATRGASNTVPSRGSGDSTRIGLGADTITSSAVSLSGSRVGSVVSSALGSGGTRSDGVNTFRAASRALSAVIELGSMGTGQLEPVGSGSGISDCGITSLVDSVVTRSTTSLAIFSGRITLSSSTAVLGKSSTTVGPATCIRAGSLSVAE
jgi:hypothetical protein